MTWTAPIAVETSVALEATGYVCGDEDGIIIDGDVLARPASASPGDAGAGERGSTDES